MPRDGFLVMTASFDRNNFADQVGCVKIADWELVLFWCMYVCPSQQECAENRGLGNDTDLAAVKHLL